MCHAVGELLVDDSGLHHGAHVSGIDFENAVHAWERDDDATLGSYSATTQTRTRPPRHYWKTSRAGQLHDLRNLPGLLGKHNRRRRTLAHTPIVFVKHQVFGTVEKGV